LRPAIQPGFRLETVGEPRHHRRTRIDDAVAEMGKQPGIMFEVRELDSDFYDRAELMIA
jgi:hypothetical protein